MAVGEQRGKLDVSARLKSSQENASVSPAKAESFFFPFALLVKLWPIALSFSFFKVDFLSKVFRSLSVLRFFFAMPLLPFFFFFFIILVKSLSAILLPLWLLSPSQSLYSRQSDGQTDTLTEMRQKLDRNLRFTWAAAVRSHWRKSLPEPIRSIVLTCDGVFLWLPSLCITQAVGVRYNRFLQGEKGLTTSKCHRQAGNKCSFHPGEGGDYQPITHKKCIVKPLNQQF